MARRVSGKLLINKESQRRVFGRRPLNIGLGQSSVAIEEGPPVVKSTSTVVSSSSSILDLEDSEKLFSSVSTGKLLKSTATLEMAAMEPMVDLGMRVMQSPLIRTPVVGNLIKGCIRRSFYDQFVAGEDLVETGRTIRRIAESSGLRGMLAYGAEHSHDDDSCHNNFKSFMEAVEFTGTLPQSMVSFVIVKMSAIIPIELLKRVSDLLRWQKKKEKNIISGRFPWKRPTLPILADSSPLYHTLEEPHPLTPEEERDLDGGHQRLLHLCQRCAELDVPLTVDAEETAVQPAIDYLTYSSASILQGGQAKPTRPVVFGTIQAYLKDSKDRLLLAADAARKMGLPLGFKLVRGAYMSTETALASSLGFDSPLHNTIHDTHHCYDDCASFLIDRATAAGSSSAVVLATHNVQSAKLAANKAKSNFNSNSDDHRVHFAQLYGMSDALSFALNNAGFPVSKYITYGPLEEVIPFLLRRADENRGMLSSSTLDRKLMWKEVKRRMMPN